MKRVIVFMVMSLLFCSCTTIVERWPSKSDEKGSRTISIEKKDNVFNDYLWTTPDIKSVKVNSIFTYNNHEYHIIELNNILSITTDNVTKDFNVKTSDNIYYDIDILQPKTVIKQRWVPKTQFVPEQVMVPKTRTVPQTSFDAKGMAHTSFVTEFYSDWETRMVSRTTWEWESYSEKFYYIPKVEYYDVYENNGDHFFIYQIYENKIKVFYLQNPEYYVAKEQNDTLFGKMDINLMFIDSQSNGKYFEQNDKMLFNVWNPYDKNSKYRSISTVLDNYWYTNNYLSDNYFLNFLLVNNELLIDYANDKYIDSKSTGKLLINNITTPKTKVTINGKDYKFTSGKAQQIQYGKYHLVIRTPNHIDYDEVFEINDKNSQQVINYRLTTAAVPLKITNLFSKTFKIFVDNNEFSKTYYNQNIIYLPTGHNRITIDVDGYKLTKEIDLIQNSSFEINFEKEISK